jgi:hypothetical protein
MNTSSPVLAAGACHLLFVSLYLFPYSGDVSALVCLSERWRGQAPFEVVRAGFSPDGYDGQFYFAIAQDPWKRHGEPIDNASYRHARILYPALAWLCSGGDPQVLLWTMPLINLAAVMAIAWLGALLATHYGRSAWWGFLLPIALNSVMPSLRNLTDPLAALTIVGLVTTWFLRWPTGLLIGWGVASVLSREQNIAIVMILLLEAGMVRQWGRLTGLAGVALVWGGWLLVLHHVYGSWPASADNIDRPLAGLWHHWTQWEGRPGRRARIVHLAQIGLMASHIAAGLDVFVRGERVTRLIALAGLGLTIVASRAIFVDFVAYSRVLNWLPLAIWLWSVQSGRRWPALLLSGSIAWPALEVLRVWLKMSNSLVIG